MILTNKQEEAIKIISNNFHTGERMTVVSGYAGVGKSSIIKYFINGMDLLDRTVFCTFTGKASLVLRQQGLPSKTIHKLIYNAYKNRNTGKYYFKLKPILDEDYRLIVVDEVSMVPAQLLRDLMSYGIPIIALGDPGQLPPIGTPNGLLDNPDVFLSEIHRQAKDNSIIRMSMIVREGNSIPLTYDDPFVKVIKRSDLEVGMLLWADQVLCAKNLTRNSINQQMRTHLGFEGKLPNINDKVICLKNYWDTINEDEFPLINGTIGTVIGKREGPNNGILGQKCYLDFEANYNENPFFGLHIDSNIFLGNAPYSTQAKNSKVIFYEFDYGYAITTHKSQGSSFPNVLFYEEHLKSSKEDHIKLVYTAITRASEKLIIVKDE